MLKVQIQGILLHVLSNWTNYIVKARSSMQYAVCSNFLQRWWDLNPINQECIATYLLESLTGRIQNCTTVAITELENRVSLCQDRIQWQALVYTAMNAVVPYKEGIYFANPSMVIILRRAVLFVVSCRPSLCDLNCRGELIVDLFIGPFINHYLSRWIRIQVSEEFVIRLWIFNFWFDWSYCV